jgi:hypothetical protein
MKTTRFRRLRGPALMMTVGAVATAAVAPAYGWGAAVPIAVIAIAAAINSYMLSGRDSDRGALARGQMDERQMLIRWQAWSFSAHLVFAASAVGALVAAVLRDPVWPFSLFIVFQVASFYAGLVLYRTRGAR